MTNGLPINRIVAFAGPYIAIISGWLANWLLVRVHLLTEFNVHKDTIESILAQGIVFGLTSILVYAGQHKWLTGWQKWETTVAGEIANGPAVVTAPQEMGTYDPATAGGDSAPVEQTEPGVPPPPMIEPPPPVPSETVSDPQPPLGE